MLIPVGASLFFFNCQSRTSFALIEKTRSFPNPVVVAEFLSCLFGKRGQAFDDFRIFPCQIELGNSP